MFSIINGVHFNFLMQQFGHSVIYTGACGLPGEMEQKEPQSPLNIQREGRTSPGATVPPYFKGRCRVKRLYNTNTEA